MVANLKQDNDQDEGNEAAEFEAGMAGAKVVDREDEAGPSTRGESEELHDALKVFSSSALMFTFMFRQILSRPYIFHAHFVQTQIIISSPLNLPVLHT